MTFFYAKFWVQGCTGMVQGKERCRNKMIQQVLLFWKRKRRQSERKQRTGETRKISSWKRKRKGNNEKHQIKADYWVTQAGENQRSRLIAVSLTSPHPVCHKMIRYKQGMQTSITLLTSELGREEVMGSSTLEHTVIFQRIKIPLKSQAAGTCPPGSHLQPNIWEAGGWGREHAQMQFQKQLKRHTNKYSSQK